MRSRSLPDHQDVVHRRLELLRAELAQEWAEPDELDGATGEVDGATDEVDGATGEAATDPWWAGHTRIPDGPPPSTEADDRPLAPVIPLPGRHAARRGRAARPADLSRFVPEVARGRVALGPWQLVVVALAVAAGLAATCWWVIRSDSSSAPMPAALAPASASPLVALPSATARTATSATRAPTQASAEASTGPGVAPSESNGTTVTVDVEGKVRHPGIAVLPAGARVIDALKAAGGATRRRYVGQLNLAAVLTDGQQIVVGGKASAPGVTGGVPAPPEGGATGGTTTLVDLNTATADQLEELPDVGPVTAQSIIDWREQNGGFASVDDLLEVDGIGEKTLAKLAPYVTV